MYRAARLYVIEMTVPEALQLVGLGGLLVALGGALVIAGFKAARGPGKRRRARQLPGSQPERQPPKVRERIA